MDELQGRVLIVEDDAAQRRSLRTTLGILGFDIGEASNGEEALLRLRMVDYDAVLLDINMPGFGGIETCIRIRRTFSKLPVLMLTVRESEDDTVRAFEAGADDYVTKPFRIRELTARVSSAIRRYRAPEGSSGGSITIGDITLDPERRRLEQAGNEIRLTPHEFDTLKLLMMNADRPVTHVQLHVGLHLPGEAANRRYLRVLIGQLRKKLGDSFEAPTYILTDGYIGYRFRVPRIED
jgi:two-component system, OmpR family, KDP operon response regulator KdpE